jgi:hypothetical protein
MIAILINVTATITAKTTFPPVCQPRDRFIYQPQAKHKIESTNQTAKFLSPKLKRDVLRKSEEKINKPNNTGTLYLAKNFFISASLLILS